MSDFYTDLTLTNFPDSDDNFVSMLDMVSGDLTLVNQFRAYILAGDFASADSVLSSITNSSQKLLRAENINAWQESLEAMQRLYRDDYENFTEEKETEWEALVNNLIYLGSYSGATTYKKNNMVYCVSGDLATSSTYIAIQDVPIGTIPTNTTYWRKFTVQGVSGTAPISLTYLGLWKPNLAYSKNNLVLYDGRLWTGTSVSAVYTPPPKEGATYCLLNLDFSPLNFNVEYSEPEYKTGGLWVQLLKEKIYGVKGLGEINPTLARTDDAVGLTFKVNASTIDSDFDNCYPYSDIVEVEDSFGNRFMRIPKFYTYRNEDELKISGGKHSDEWLLNPCFTYGGLERDYVYVGKYEASGTSDRVYSKTGQNVLVNISIEQSRTACRANGASYLQTDLWINQMLRDLFTVEFATTNSQSIMYGYTNYNSVAISTGRTDRVLSASGSPVSNTTGTYACKYRGIENPYGNVRKFIDGVLASSGLSLYVCYNPSLYSHVGILNYHLLNYNLSNVAVSSYLKKTGKDPSHSFALFPIDEYINNTKYYCSNYLNLGSSVIQNGGYFAEGFGCGMYYTSIINQSSTVSNLDGTRLCAYELL